MDKWNLSSRNPTKANLQEDEDWQGGASLSQPQADPPVQLQLLEPYLKHETAQYRETFRQLMHILRAPPTPNTKKDFLRILESEPVLLARFIQKCAIKQAMELIEQHEQSASSTELVHLDQILQELVIGEDNPAQGGQPPQQ